MNEIKEKLLKELKLHDATIDTMRLHENEFSFKVDCKAMSIKNMFNNLDNAFFRIKCFDVIKINFDIEGMIIIDQLNIREQEGFVVIETLNGELYVECEKYDIEINLM